MLVHNDDFELLWRYIQLNKDPTFIDFIESLGRHKGFITIDMYNHLKELYNKTIYGTI